MAHSFSLLLFFPTFYIPCSLTRAVTLRFVLEGHCTSKMYSLTARVSWVGRRQSRMLLKDVLKKKSQYFVTSCRLWYGGRVVGNTQTLFWNSANHLRRKGQDTCRPTLFVYRVVQCVQVGGTLHPSGLGSLLTNRVWAGSVRRWRRVVFFTVLYLSPIFLPLLFTVAAAEGGGEGIVRFPRKYFAWFY